MQQPALTLMIVDDHPLMRRGVRQLLALEPRLSVIAEASNGTEALAEARRQEPDIILLDLNMKGLSGLDTLKALRHDGIHSRILVLTVSDARSDIFAMVDAGADGYLLKDSEPDILLGHILQASRGEKVFSEASPAIWLIVSTAPIRCVSSPNASGMSCRRWRAACRTRRLPPYCISRKRPSKCISATCCASWMSAHGWQPR